MEKIVEGGAIAPLCTLLKSVGELGAKRGRKKNVQLDPTTELAFENATGAMRHLSFHDPSIAQLAAGGVIPVRTRIAAASVRPPRGVAAPLRSLCPAPRVNLEPSLGSGYSS